MSCTPAPACKAMLAQATAMFPQRSKASDGVCPGPNHPPTGDHPNGEAVDLTHDPGHGCDVDWLFARIVARRDPRVKYLIRNRRILRSYAKPGIPAWTWAPYSGDNPHDKHGHCSILPGARDNVSAWFGVAPPPIPQPEPEENDMASKIWRPVGNPAQPHVGGEFLQVGDLFVALSADTKQQLANSETGGDPAKLCVQDAEPELWKAITVSYQNVRT